MHRRNEGHVSIEIHGHVLMRMREGTTNTSHAGVASYSLAMSNFDVNEVCVNLLSDDELRETSKTRHELREMIDTFLREVKPQTVQHLDELIMAVEKSYDKSRKARIAGTVATITGSTLAIVGFGLSFATFGASLGLTAGGAALAAAGGVTIGGAEIGYLAIARDKLKNTEKVCRDYNEEMHKIENRGREFSNRIDSLASKYPTFSKEAILHLLRYTWNSTEPVLKTFYTGYKLVDGATDVGRNTVTVTNSVRAGVQAGARTVYLGLGTVGRIFSIGSVALDVLFIPIDMAVLVKSAHDVHKYKNGNGKSNSTAAANIRSVLKQLEEHEKELERVRDQLSGDTNDDIEK